MVLPLLYIRIKQLQKEINGLGLYLLVLIPLAGFLIFLAFKIFEKGENHYWLIAALAGLCLILQYYRKDKTFVYKHIESPHLQIFYEYVALSFPFAITCVFTKQWFCYPILLFVLFCIPFFQFNIRQKVVFKNLSVIIPASNFEWLSGFRKQYISFILLYLAALSFSWFKIVPLLLLWFLTVMIASFYNECESIQVLRQPGKSPRSYLLSKFKISTFYVLVLYTPILIINILCNPVFLIAGLLFIPTQISLLYFSISLKYSSYRPNRSALGNNIPLSIVGIMAVLPYSFPVPALLAFRYFYKAEKNLKNYLDD